MKENHATGMIHYYMASAQVDRENGKGSENERERSTQTDRHIYFVATSKVIKYLDMCGHAIPATVIVK